MVDYTIVISAVNNASRGINRLESDLSRVESRAARVGASLRRVAQFAGLASAAVIVRGITQQYLEYERYQAVLTTFLGTQAAANAKLDELKDFANTIPQSLSDLTGAFVILQRAGIDNTSDALESFADIAAGSGRSLNQLAEALADAVTGEFERLKEFGIKVSRENDQFVARFGDQTVAIGATAKQLTDQLTQLGRSGGVFDGAADNFASTLTIAFSNLSGAVFDLSVSIGDLVAPAAIAAINSLATGIVFVANNIERFVITAGVAAVVLGGRFAVAVGVTAVAAVFRLVASLTALKVALIRTGIGAFIVLAGELIYQLTRVSGAVETWAEAFALVGGVGVEIFGRLQEAGGLFLEFMGTVATSMTAYFNQAFGNMVLGAANSISMITNSLGPIGREIAASLGIDGSGLTAFAEDLVSSAEYTIASIPDMLASYGESLSQIGRPLESLAALQAAIAAAGATSSETETDIEELVAALGALPGGVNPATTALEDFKAVVEAAGSTLATDLAQSLRTGEGGLAAFGNFFTGLMDQIVAKILEVAVVQPILDGLFSTGGKSGGIIAGIAGIFAGGFAKGGRIPGGQYGMVGENGPELISGPGTVYSNSDSAQMLGGSGGGGIIAPVFNTTINPGADTSPEAAREFARQFNSTIEAKVTDTIIKIQNRGGGGFRTARNY
jgi:hypothetical protein